MQSHSLVHNCGFVHLKFQHCVRNVEILNAENAKKVIKLLNFIKKWQKIEKCNTEIKNKLYLCPVKQIKKMAEKEKSTRGGRRAGAGRPRTDSQLFTFRAGGNIAQCINSQENKTDFIVGCIASEMKKEAAVNKKNPTP